MSGKFKTTWFYAALGNFDVKQGLIFKKTVKEISNRNVDFDEYTQGVQNAYESFDAEGYDVINVIPIQIGATEQCTQTNGPQVVTASGTKPFSSF